MWKRGDKKSAKELSDLGKAEKAQVEDLNRRAARAIFRENNQHRDEHTIDLHGLFVKVSVVIQDLTRKVSSENSCCEKIWSHCTVRCIECHLVRCNRNKRLS